MDASGRHLNKLAADGTSSLQASPGNLGTVRSLGLTALVAALTFLIAYDNGSYSLESRNILAIVVWWGVLVVLALRFRSLRTLPVASWVTIGLLALFVAWTGLSAAWSNDTETVVAELNRAGLYLGLAVLVVLVVTRRSLPSILDGIGLGIVSISALALTSRFLPGVASMSAETLRAAPAAAVRLSYPVGYWNGLGILAALGAPLLLRTATSGRTRVGRCLAAGALPLLGTTIDLTSSRGAAAVAVVGVVVFLVATSERWDAVAAATAGFIGSILAVEGIHAAARSDMPAGSDQGTAVVIMAVGCGASAVLFLFWEGLTEPRGHPAPAVGWIAGGLVVVLLFSAIAVSHPVRRFQEFKQPETAQENADPGHIRTSFATASGSGRWQYWIAAADEFRASPLKGGGAGSYGTWWLRHASLPRFILDAHSLYLETLAELGVVGLLALLGSLVAALGAAAHRLLRAVDRRVLATALAVLVAYLLGAAIDWMWELTVVSLVGVVCLAVLVGPATAEDGSPDTEQFARHPKWPVLLGAAAAAAAVAAIVVALAPLLAQIEIESSRAAARRGDTASAISHARTARKIEPWAASPYLQLALANEQAGSYRTARQWLQRAIARDPEDWRLWVVSARIETLAGRIAEARTSLARARELNPRSEIFSTS